MGKIPSPFLVEKKNACYSRVFCFPKISIEDFIIALLPGKNWHIYQGGGKKMTGMAFLPSLQQI